VLLENRNAVIYGGGGSIGGAVARAFAREGARVFLVGRTAERLDRVAGEVRAAGGAAQTAVLDALDEHAVDRHAESVVAAAGSIDISFNLISIGDVQGTPVADMAVEDYVRPVMTAIRSTFLTARAAARQMIKQRSGVILAFGGEADPPRGYHLGSLQVAFHAIDAMRRQLASELGSYGVRTVTLRTGGIPESIPDSFSRKQAIAEAIAGATLLGRAATLDDVGNAAAFAASDRARMITGATIDISSGTFFS
jgi:3-oxoacyl-[acyl-carrier protein] reductase